MKKTLNIVLIALLVLCIASSAEARSRRMTVNQWNYGIPGNFFQIVSGGQLNMTDGVAVLQDTLITVAAASATAYFDNDIATSTLIAGATLYTLAAGDFTNAEHCRNIVVDIDFATGESTATFVGTALISGVNGLGDSVTETLVLSTNSVTGNVAWSGAVSVLITATTISVTPNDSDVNIEMGTGNKLGLANNITASTDLIRIIEGTSWVDPTTTTVSVTYNTVTPASSPSDTNYEMRYKARAQQ
jgi:hypothetical protein